MQFGAFLPDFRYCNAFGREPESLNVGELNQAVKDLREMLHERQRALQHAQSHGTFRMVVVVPEDKRITVHPRPHRIWSLAQGTSPDEDLLHQRNAFLEDFLHDWNYENGVLRYYSRVGNPGDRILLEWDAVDDDGEKIRVTNPRKKT